MGLSNRTNQNTIYCRAADSKIVVKSSNTDKEAVKRMNKNGEEVWERLYDDLSGKLVSIDLKEGEFKGSKTKDWHFTVSDGDTRYIITLRYDSSYSKKLINALANVDDFSNTLCFYPWRMDEVKSPTGKLMVGISLYKGAHPTKANRIMPKYERDQMPLPKEVVLKGATQFDDTELCAFLENVVNTEIKPRLAEAKSDADADRLGAEVPETADEDDVPF
jgi:hypothetical protein